MPRFPEFPLLDDTNSVKTSDATAQYNCIAWAAGDDSRKWWPHIYGYWPIPTMMIETIDAFLAAFATLGYESCADGSLEREVEKVALYAEQSGTPTHMARQLPDGTWTSKLGDDIDMTHATVDALHGQFYGRCVAFMGRRKY